MVSRSFYGEKQTNGTTHASCIVVLVDRSDPDSHCELQVVGAGVWHRDHPRQPHGFGQRQDGVLRREQVAARRQDHRAER